ncbi:Rrf2 family transcriptional regulator [Rubrobacter marinus]|uniref:Rrf2 family transcriptional regulator n=1 Tax=Rubrobacter marinus TaxID=2653852 RepID=A0A6G8PZ13_9ACTN|nr:Rrf2 family transcriptional regulator [Rubrobacter marinus]QIN79469.1 Rrf2 family transcriptional regulator [Rubrobacter marinus]
MRLTQKSKYAVRALMELALDDCGSPLGVTEVARRQRIPERFLEQIFGDLRRAKILESRRGARGGFCFAIPPGEITILDIVEVLDGEVRPARCSAGGQCYIADAPLCVTSKVWDEAREALEGVFGRYTIAQIAAEERANRAAHAAARDTETPEAQSPFASSLR